MVSKTFPFINSQSGYCSECTPSYRTQCKGIQRISQKSKHLLSHCIPIRLSDSELTTDRKIRLTKQNLKSGTLVTRRANLFLTQEHSINTKKLIRCFSRFFFFFWGGKGGGSRGVGFKPLCTKCVHLLVLHCNHKSRLLTGKY